MAGSVACTIGSLHAAPKFSGATGYEIVKNSTEIVISAGAIENTSKENATGTLMLKVWARDTPYQTGTLGGELLGSYKLEGLAPGRQYTALKKSVAYTPPKVKKNYVIVLSLVEYQAKAGGYVVVDHRNMPNTIALGPLKLFQMDGPTHWQTSTEGGTVDIEVAKITHRRTGNTGDLKLSVWATKEPYHGGALNGYEIGSVMKKPLAPGYSYTDVKNTAKYIAPPEGNYYVNIILLEFGSDRQYSVVAHMAGSKQSTFGAPH
ncbi:MAG: hypothetical protein K8R87_11630 [Verrucomicrobia bacterium]|nr:hypothetical protein [Verrucomicrobiota bacterium]